MLVTETFEPEIGGGETQARTLSDALVARGYSVQLVTRRSRQGLPRVERQGDLTIVRVPPVGAGRWKKWGLSVTSFPALLAAARGADAVLVSGFRILGAPAIVATRLRDVPCVLKGDNRGEMSGEYFRAGLARGGLTPGSLPIRAFLALRNHVLRFAEAFVALSEEMAAEFRECGVLDARVHQIPNGVDVEYFRPPTPAERQTARDRLHLPPGPIVLYSGRLVTHKGVPQLVRAWEALKQDGALGTLLIVGEGGADMHNCEEELRSVVRERGMEGIVRFTGPVRNVRDYLHAADVFVFPTLDDSFGLSLVEAMACALPVITTPMGGIRDFLVDGTNGILVAAGDERELAAAIGRSLADELGLRELGSAARVTAVERFSHESVADRYVQLVDSLRARAGGDAA